jgi:probable F420-dependent oxidoreductase
MSRWGVTLPLTGVALAAHRELVRELPELGYTDVWSAETAGTDAFTPLALVAEWAPQLRLGTAIVPVYTRGAGLLAMTAATLAELAPGRFVLGVGTSTPTIVENWNSMQFTEPYARTRDTVRFLRSALAGDKVTHNYSTFSVSKFRLERPPETQPGIVVAALRPGMLRLAAREADGAITNWLSPTDVSTVRAELGPDRELVARIFVCPTEDTEAARGLGRLLISSYLTVPVYAAFHDWLGRGEALRGMHEAWAAGDRAGANAAIPDRVVDDLVVHGSVDHCRERIAAYVEAGLDTPVIGLLPTGVDPAEMVRALAPRR